MNQFNIKSPCINWKTIIVHCDNEIIKYELGENEKLVNKMKRLKKRSLLLSKIMLNQKNSYQSALPNLNDQKKIVFNESSDISQKEDQQINTPTADSIIPSKPKFTISNSEIFEKPEVPIIIFLQRNIVEKAMKKAYEKK